MPGKLSWSDSFNALVVPDTIAYVLPTEFPYKDAPSHIAIDGFATLKMERTRISVHGDRTLRMVDDTVRNPLRAQVITADTPAPAAPHAAPARNAAPQPQAVPVGPALGLGAGNIDRDTPLFTLGRMILFGLCAAAVAAGACLIGAHAVVGACLLAVGVIGMLLTLAANPYHIIGQASADEAARAAQAAEADLQDALI